MRWTRIAAFGLLALFVAASPLIALAGVAAWQQHAPGSLRQAVLALSAFTEPARHDRPAERIEVAVDTAAANPG